jgi:hypothetical protein
MLSCLNAQDHPRASLTINFTLKKKVSFGEGVYIVGNIPELGNWNPLLAAKLFWTEGDNWKQTLTFDIPTLQETTIEYKYIIAGFHTMDQNHLQWEERDNRILRIDPKEIPSPSAPSTSAGSRKTSHYLHSTDKVNFSKKHHSFELCSIKPDVKSLDCSGQTFAIVEASSSLLSHVEVFSLSNVESKTLAHILGLFPHHLSYYDENLTTGKVAVVLFSATKWRLVKADAPFPNLCWCELKATDSETKISVVCGPGPSATKRNRLVQMLIQDHQILLTQTGMKDGQPPSHYLFMSLKGSTPGTVCRAIQINEFNSNSEQSCRSMLPTILSDSISREESGSSMALSL